MLVGPRECPLLLPGSNSLPILDHDGHTVPDLKMQNYSDRSV